MQQKHSARGQERESYLSLSKCDQIFHKRKTVADFGLEKQQIELGLDEIL